MKRLWILRHAKSSWSDEGLGDHERPLAPRGERAAVLIGATMAQRGIRPDRVLASTAVRVRETLERLQGQLAERVPVSFEETLYMASTEEWIERLRAIEGADGVLVVGHNPGLEDLISALAPKGDKAALRRLREGLPTAALAEVLLRVDRWSELRPGVGRLASLERPKDLV